MLEYNILHCFISHQAQINSDILRITKECKNHNISDYIIVCGGYSESYIDDHVLYLDCNDSYEGLPDKIYNLCKYLYNNYKLYDFYAKLDRDIRIVQPISKTLELTDYCGALLTKEGYRDWHFNKCSSTSDWNQKLYSGKYVPWCNGGKGYFLSTKALKIISDNPPDCNYHIYEDVYVANTLLDIGNIKAKNLHNLKNFFKDSIEKK